MGDAVMAAILARRDDTPNRAPGPRPRRSI